MDWMKMGGNCVTCSTVARGELQQTIGHHLFLRADDLRLGSVQMVHTPYMETTLSNRSLSDLQRAQGVTYVQISQHGQSYQRKSLLTQACNTDVKSCSTRPLRERHVQQRGHGKKALALEKMTLR